MRTEIGNLDPETNAEFKCSFVKSKLLLLKAGSKSFSKCGNCLKTGEPCYQVGLSVPFWCILAQLTAVGCDSGL